MTTNRERLALIGQALYGQRWMRAVARDLNVDQRQVQRWANGEYETPAGVIADLELVAARKRGEIDGVLK